MGHFRFRRSMKIAPGLKLNFNKNSTSLTFGGKGAHYTVNSKGSKTTTFGIPGTGLYYTDVKKPKETQKEKTGSYNYPNYQQSSVNNNDSYYYQQNASNYNTQSYYNENDNSNDPKKIPFYQKTWFIILMLLFVSPVGIFLMWYFKDWHKIIKIILSLFFIFYFVIYCGVFG